MATQTASTELSTQTQAAPPAVAGTHAAPVAAPRWTAAQIQEASFEAGAAIPSLKEAKAVPLPIGVAYWSPEAAGESKRVFVAGLGLEDVVDPMTGEVRKLDSVFLLEVTETESGERKALKWVNSSRILVANIRSAVEKGIIIPGTGLTPIEITYMGQVKNRTNSKLSKRWEILPLNIN